MTIQDKVLQIKEIVTLVCNVLPEIIGLIKEIVLAIKDMKTV